MSFVLEMIFEFVFETLSYWVGRLVVNVLSFGRWKCEPPPPAGAKRKTKLFQFRYRRADQIYLTAETTQLIGVLTLTAVVAGAIFTWYRLRN